MSACDLCGAKSQHISVTIFWATQTASVRHRCPNKDFHPFGYEFEEDARDPKAAAFAALGIKDDACPHGKTGGEAAFCCSPGLKQDGDAQ